jgi:hypothetical protein
VGEVVKRPEIGEQVYRVWERTTREVDPDRWYEPYFVWKLTAKRVYIEDLEGKSHFLDRQRFERRGRIFHSGLGCLFVVERPEAYVRKTIGFILAEGPREVLQLKQFFTPTELKAAYHRRSRETHPDRGGDETAFKKVQAAYDHLSAEPVEQLMTILEKMVEKFDSITDLVKEVVKNS